MEHAYTRVIAHSGIIGFPSYWNRCMSYNEAVVLADLLVTRNYPQPDGTSITEEPFPCPDLAFHHGLNPNTISEILKRLKRKELISYERIGLPAQNYYTINDDGLFLLDSVCHIAKEKGFRTVKQGLGMEFSVEAFEDYRGIK